MKKTLLTVGVAVAVCFLFGMFFAYTPATGQAGNHPRLRTAIVNIEDAIDYLKKAPNTFGGHKASAIDACQKAVHQLKLALEYEAKTGKKGR